MISAPATPLPDPPGALAAGWALLPNPPPPVAESAPTHPPGDWLRVTQDGHYLPRVWDDYAGAPAEAGDRRPLTLTLPPGAVAAYVSAAGTVSLLEYPLPPAAAWTQWAVFQQAPGTQANWQVQGAWYPIQGARPVTLTTPGCYRRGIAITGGVRTAVAWLGDPFTVAVATRVPVTPDGIQAVIRHQAAALTVEAADLRAALAQIKPALAAGPRLPILECVLVAGTPTGLTITATNLEIYSAATVGGRDPAGAAAWAVALPYALLVALLPARGAVRVQHTDFTQVQITAGGDRLDLAGQEAAEFPLDPQPAQWTPVSTWPATLLGQLRREVQPYAATADTRPALQALCWDLPAPLPAGDSTAAPAHFWAADGFRLIHLTVPLPATQAGRYLIPAAHLPALGGLTGSLTVAAGAKPGAGAPHLLRFTGAGGGVIVRLLDAPFPNFAAHLPDPATAAVQATLDGAPLHAALQRVSALAKQQANAITLVAAAGELRVQARDGGTAGDLLVPAQLTGEGQVALNYTYLLALARRYPTLTLGWYSDRAEIRWQAGEVEGAVMALHAAGR